MTLLLFYLEQRAIFAGMEALDTGRPIDETMLDLDSAIECFEYFSGVASSLAGQHIDMGQGNFAMTRREPLGVCAGIGAW